MRRGRNPPTVARAMRAESLIGAIAAYNMVNPCVISGGVRYAPRNENPHVAREFAVADQVAALRGGNPNSRPRRRKGTKDKTGG